MEDDQQFCLRWNNHQTTLVEIFDKLLRKGILVDCTLAAEGKYLDAHRVVLTACSPYFEALLSRHYDKHPILVLPNVKFQELKAMMDYMYRGEVNISQDQLGALLKAAESLQIRGLSDNKREERNATAPAAAPPPPRSPPPPPLPRTQGLSIEQNRQQHRNDARSGSKSPGPRKRRRHSEEMENHHDGSNSSESHSLPAQNIPSTLPLSSEVPDTVETKQEILTRPRDDTQQTQISASPQVPTIKEKLETHTELILEPKSEYVEEINEDSIEDLTLDDDDLSNMEQMDEAGPSHAGEGTSQQGFGQWHMGAQSQDEVFLAAQEAVGAHRDSQGKLQQHTNPAQRRRFSLFLFDFIKALLDDESGRYLQYLHWKDKSEGIFKIVDPNGLARLWGQLKNVPRMNYDKLSRALRNYYKSNRMRKVNGQRHCFQFILDEQQDNARIDHENVQTPQSAVLVQENYMVPLTVQAMYQAPEDHDNYSVQPVEPLDVKYENDIIE